MRRLLEPSEFEPTPVDLRQVALIGIGLWAIALATIGVLAAFGVDTGNGAVVCVTGVALGGIGLLWERRHRTLT